MKIALITTNLTGGGAERVFLRWAEMLGARGHDVHVLLLERRIDHAVASSVRLHALTREGQACRKGFIGKRLAAWRLRARLRELARGAPFDLHVSTLPFADEVTALARVPRRWHRVANTLSAEIGRLGRAKAERRLARYRALYRGANLIAVSDGVAADLRERLQVAAAQIVRIYNPFDFGAIRALARQPDAAIPTEPYVIHVGGFRPQKRHDLLLQAFAQAALSERLVLLCEPHTQLDQMIEAAGLGDRVTVAGFKQNPYPWIAAARCLALSSDHEGMPNVLVEALACGTPVVSTDCPSGPREILMGALARGLTPCNDAPRFAQALRSAMTWPRLASGEADESLAPFAAATIVRQIESLAETSAAACAELP